MNRRGFLMTLGAGGVLAVTGCSRENAGEKLVGYWKQQKPKDSMPWIFHIERNGAGFTYTEARWTTNFTNWKYKVGALPAVLQEGADNTLSVGGMAAISYEESTGLLITPYGKAERITKEDFDKMLATTKEAGTFNPFSH